jgi:hypothetical protein
MDPKHLQYHLREVVEDCGEGKFWWQGWDGKIHEWQLHGYSERIEELPPTPSGALGTEMKLELHISRKSYYYGEPIPAPNLSRLRLRLTLSVSLSVSLRARARACVSCQANLPWL